MAKSKSEGQEVQQLARYQVRPDVLYPECLAPVEFVDYQLIVSNTEPRP